MQNSPESMALAVIDSCADCDVCRYLMEDTPCRVFPALYELYDRAREGGVVSPGELRNLVDLCNFCALCPCQNVRSEIMKAKHAFISRDGIDPAIRLLEDIERLAKVCGAYPSLANKLFQGNRTGGVLKKITGIHPDRNLPVFPGKDFANWAEKNGLRGRQTGEGKRVAFFAGCTGQYLFPDVPKAAVEVLRRNGIDVYMPEQKCCGMPSLLEGDIRLTLKMVSFNLDRLCEAVDSGYRIVCSCPTCAYMLKHVLSEGAYYSREYRESAVRETGTPEQAGQSKLRQYKPSKIDNLLRDEGCFSSVDALKRIKVAENTFDLGEYLRDLRDTGEFNENFGPVPAKTAYYPPCHLREQKIGEPYADLLALLPGISMKRIDGAFHCCGIAGIMGFKKSFHPVSVEIGSRLAEKIKEIHPERLAVDCLSCRIQFNQMLPYKVFHPIEILCEAYRNFRTGPESSPVAI